MGREMGGRGHGCPMADSSCCLTETTTFCKAINLQLKNNLKWALKDKSSLALWKGNACINTNKNENMCINVRRFGGGNSG